VVTQWFKQPGDMVILLGNAEPSVKGLGGSEYVVRKLGKIVGDAPKIDLAAEAKLQKLVLELAQARKLASAHDVSEGGLAVALAECATTGPTSEGDVGARVDVELPSGGGDASTHAASLLFGEHPTRVIVSVRPEHVAGVREAATRAGVPLAELGVTGGGSLSVALVAHRGKGALGEIVTRFVVKVADVRAAREGCLDAIVAR